MAGIDELIKAITGQVDQGVNAPPPSWQQELLATVNPEKVKRQNIARALSQFSTKLATTPGNFLNGIAAGTAAGANSYLTGKDDAEQQRMKVQQLVQMSQQNDQDRRLKLLFDAVGVQRNQEQDRQSAESHKADLEYKNSQTEYYKTRGTGSSGVDSARERKEGNAAQAFFSWMDKQNEKLGDYPDEAAQDEMWGNITRRFGLDDTGSAAPAAPAAGSPQVARPPAAPPAAPATPAAPSANTGGIVQPSPKAMEFLKNNPQHRAAFDQKYGPGASAAILGD